MLPIDQITIRFPARPGSLFLSRLNAAALATEAGFDVDELDDLRLAISEATTWLLHDSAGDGSVELVMSGADGSVEIVGTRSAKAVLPDRPLDDLISAVLGATVDSHALSFAAHSRTIELRKSAHR